MRHIWVAALFAFASLWALPSESAAELELRIDEGQNINGLVRDDEVAAHLLLRSGTKPRILVAFPAGNSGVGLWFSATQRPVSWTLHGSPRPVSRKDAKGRPLHGLEVEASIDAPSLAIKQVVLSSVRVLRDYERTGTAPAEVLTTATAQGDAISWMRHRLDGAPGYQLTVAPLAGASIEDGIIQAGSGPSLRLKIVALTGETPLAPLSGNALLRNPASADERSRDVLAFLSYRDKYLAGSWRFDTYFGRDTLLSLSVLAPVLQPQALESGISSVLERLSSEGEVAHEEDIGEFAILRNAKEGRGRKATPIYDYGMVDDDFLLAPLAATALLETQGGRARAPAFLAARNATRERNGDALVRNLRWVVERTAAFADDPRPQNLVGIKEGRTTGNWRDSDEGLGRGVYAYDINAVFVPAALDAIDRLLDSRLLDPYVRGDSRRALERAGRQMRVWSQRAPELFVTKVESERARSSIAEYAASLGIDAERGLGALQPGPVEFDALSLDAEGRPIPVLHSDVGFALLFGVPSQQRLERAVAVATRPFPAGLLTPVGLLVANPVFAAADLQVRFSNSAYHGTVIWSWQQAVLAAGLSRQLARNDLSASLREKVLSARERLWSSIERANALRTSELWSWSFDDGEYRVEPFGKRSGDEDESNAAQLWSTIYLGFQGREWSGARQRE